MIELKGDFDNMTIAAPKLRPFVEMQDFVCYACGHRGDNWWRRVVRNIKAKIICVPCSVQYCGGDKPPSEDQEMSIFFRYGARTKVNQCAGIPFPHLHVYCSKCHAEWLMNGAGK